ncbi:MAG TPA: ATP-binding cassette domain-containing protein [Rhodothermales bacterium]|nr:ATP-binding cassette domain-containing protein [Rhodothermales bacterium]
MVEPVAHIDATIEVRHLTMAYGSTVIMRDVSFDVLEGEIAVIMGPSGSGKSTLMKHLVGLYEPTEGQVVYNGESFTEAGPARRNELLRSFGVLYQNGALWGSMTLAENVAFPLEEYTKLSKGEIAEVVQLKLALVGLRGFETYFPSEISGGMRKRAALARAIAMDPKILFFDEPSAGLDPVSSRRLDDLILRLRDYFGTTVVIVTHELPSIFAVGDKAIYLDTEERTVTAIGSPRALQDHPPNERVRLFMTRGG